MSFLYMNAFHFILQVKFSIIYTVSIISVFSAPSIAGHRYHQASLLYVLLAVRAYRDLQITVHSRYSGQLCYGHSRYTYRAFVFSYRLPGISRVTA